MPGKKKPSLLWTRDDLFFDESGVREIGNPKPQIAASTAAPRQTQSPQVARPPHTGDYTVAELAKEWRLSTAKIRQLFRQEPGVVKLKDDNFYKKRKRPYVTLRIPAEVAARVKRRLS
jgi:hypothetical protein